MKSDKKLKGSSNNIIYDIILYMYFHRDKEIFKQVFYLICHGIDKTNQWICPVRERIFFPWSTMRERVSNISKIQR